MRPIRENGETRENWIERLADWEKTPEGLEYMASRARFKMEERALAERRRLEAIGLPADVIRLFHEELSATACLARVRSEQDVLLVLAGAPGAGKTVAACWAFRAADGIFLRAAKLARWDRYDMDAMDSLLETNLLVIDDLGSEFLDGKGNFMAIFDEVIADRSENLRRTIMTANMTADVFRERYGERVADRIRKYGAYFETNEESLRKKG